MQPDVVHLSAWRQRKDREARKDRVQEALGHLYHDVLKKLADENRMIHPADLEAFFVEIITDHLMRDFRLSEDRARVIADYQDFDQQLRDSIAYRLFTSKSLFSS